MALQVTPIVVQRGELHQGPSPFVSAFEVRELREGVQFHLLAESAAATNESLCGRALQTFQRSLEGQSRVALTTALNRAFQDCHKEIRTLLQKEPLAARVGAGLTVLVLQNDAVTFAQAGPGVLYVREASSVRRLEAPGVSATGFPDELLGIATKKVPVALGRHSLRPGQALLAAYGAFARVATYDGLHALLAASPEETARTLHALMREERSFAALRIDATA
jgi:hypothetical protein